MFGTTPVRPFLIAVGLCLASLTSAHAQSMVSIKYMLVF